MIGPLARRIAAHRLAELPTEERAACVAFAASECRGPVSQYLVTLADGTSRRVWACLACAGYLGDGYDRRSESRGPDRRGPEGDVPRALHLRVEPAPPVPEWRRRSLGHDLTGWIRGAA